MKSFLLLTLAPLWAAASPLLANSNSNQPAPIVTSDNSETVPDSYMIVFQKDVSHDDALIHHNFVQDLHIQVEKTKAKKRDLAQFVTSAFGGLKHTYHIPGRLLGYSGHFDEEVIEAVRRHPQVCEAPAIALQSD